MDEEPSDGTSVRAITRALRLISLMNKRVMWRFGELHEQAGLPKATLSRILRTLAKEGYVTSDNRTGVYRLTSNIRTLSSGYSESGTIIEVGSPMLIRATKQIRWPLAIGLPDHAEMVIHFSTMPYSPLASFTTTLGFRRGLMETAMGQAYVAFCHRDEQDVIMNLLAPAEAKDGPQLQREMQTRLAEIKRQGHAVRLPSPQNETATLAVPIIANGSAISVLGMTTYGRSMTVKLVEEHVPTLQRLAEDISTVYLHGESPSQDANVEPE